MVVGLNGLGKLLNSTNLVGDCTSDLTETSALAKPIIGLNLKSKPVCTTQPPPLLIKVLESTFPLSSKIPVEEPEVKYATR